MTNCGHTWKPVPGWHARYRCNWCGALGYKQLVNDGARGRQAQLVIYVCRHPECKAPAVVGPKKGQKCAEHCDPEYLPRDVKRQRLTINP